MPETEVVPFYKDDSMTIYCGRSEDIVPTLGDFDLLLTDPPYGLGESWRKQRNRRQAAGVPFNWGIDKILGPDYGEEDWDDEPISPELMEMVRSTTKNQIIMGGQFYDLPPTSCWLVWDKQNTGDFADFEMAWTNLKQANRMIRWRWNGLLKQMPEKRYHPTQKPVSVMKWCIKQSKIEPGSTILDPFMGSGTTLVAASRMGMKATGIDQSEKYCEIAVRRLKQETRPLFV